MNTPLPLALAYDDVLLIPQYSEITSRSDVDLSVKLTPRLSLRIPLISANMSDVTGVEMAITLGKLGAMGVLPRFLSPNEQVEMVKQVKRSKVPVGAAVGLKEESLKRAELLMKSGADAIFLDVAHGHMKKALEVTSELKNKFSDSINLVSGNIATYEGADALFSAGADSVKVGVGPGSICTTRIETGSGVPQFTAVLEASKAAKKHHKTLIADGGTKSAGDIVKGLAAGATAIMAGNQFAGTKEAPGKLVVRSGLKFKSYNASTSSTEKKNHVKTNGGGGLSKNYVKQIEGVESLVPYKGSVKQIVERLIAGVRSGLSYSGSKNIEELWHNAKFIQVTTMGRRESEPHDVIVASK